MKKMLLLLSLLSVVACKPKEDIPNDAGARASGRYIVLSYSINGDTLYTNKGVNKIGVSSFYITVSRRKADSVQVLSTYRKIIDDGSINHIKYATVNEANGILHLSLSDLPLSIYESRIEGDTLYEKTALGGPGIGIVPPGYSLKNPSDPALKGILILAKR